MSEHTKLFERAAARYEVPDMSTDGLLRRRDRKRRNQRIAAGVVGIAVFVAAIWIVTTGGAFDHAQTEVVPGGAGTGPAETGPAGPSGLESGFSWPPAEGVEPSTPASGEWVAGDHGIHPWFAVRVYADGRVIWLNANTTLEGWQQRRLSPEWVDLVRSGTIELGGQHSAPGQALPTSAWEDADWKPYIPSMFVACTARDTIHLLPQQAEDLLRDYTNEQAVERGEVNYSSGALGATCPAVTIEEFRALDQILLEGGWKAIENSGALVYESRDLDAGVVHPATIAGITVIGLLPDGSFEECCPG
jgi:hypothetical protein